jgi:diphthine synthase
MEEGVGFEVVPGMSATALAVSLSGLQSYKFGRQVTLPYPYGEYLATSPLEMIETNRSSGLHTLVLLDLDPTGMGFDLPTPMRPEQAVSILDRMADRVNEEREISNPTTVREWDGILLSDVGTSRQRVSSGSLNDVSKLEGGYVHTLIIPSNMSDNEKDAFRRRNMS